MAPKPGKSAARQREAERLRRLAESRARAAVEHWALSNEQYAAARELDFDTLRLLHTLASHGGGEVGEAGIVPPGSGASVSLPSRKRTDTGARRAIVTADGLRVILLRHSLRVVG